MFYFMLFYTNRSANNNITSMRVYVYLNVQMQLKLMTKSKIRMNGKSNVSYTHIQEIILLIFLRSYWSREEK